MFFKLFFKPHPIYLDYASVTPIDTAMLRSAPALEACVEAANPSALHTVGASARRVIEEARATAARAIGAHPDEIIFTSGATESDNLALRGVVNDFVVKGIEPSSIMISTGRYEHSAVSETVQALSREGVQSMFVSEPNDIVVPQGVTVLIVSVMYVHNETGLVAPIKDIAKRIRKLRKDYPAVKIIFHTDATQAPLYYSLRVDQLGIDMVTLGATKLYCPKGVGLLYKRRTISLSPIIFGGGQEHGLRPGTEPVGLIHQFAYALSYAQQNVEAAAARTRIMQEYFEMLIERDIPSALITDEDKERSPHISHIALPGSDSELLVIELDARGILVSAKSACKNEEAGESAIVEHIYGPTVGAVRFSFGRTTTKRGIERAVAALKEVLQKYSYR